MNTPRLRLRNLGRDEHPAGNGAAPRVRLREQSQQAPETAAPKESGARRLLQPLPLTGVVLVLVALIGYWAVYSSSTRRTPILVSTHALAAGAVLSASDLRTGELAGDSTVLAALLPARDLSQSVGRRLASPVPAGAPLPAGALAGPQAQSPALTLSIPELQVTGAGLQVGDRVTVLATFGAGGGQASTRPVARGLQVMAVGEAGPNADPSTATVPVTVAVSEPSMTSQLALANEDAKLDLLVEGSGASTAPIPSASQASVAGAP
jgi:Flp pilus assembly protein CpaB